MPEKECKNVIFTIYNLLIIQFCYYSYCYHILFKVETLLINNKIYSAR